MTPFSGISLLLHLVIIGVAKIYYYVSGQSQTKPSTITLGQAADASPLSRFASFAIVITVMTLMLASFGRAVTTSVREGAKEPQIQFVKHQVAALMHSDWQAFFGSARAQNSPEDSNLAPTTVPSETSIYTLSK